MRTPRTFVASMALVVTAALLSASTSAGSAAPPQQKRFIVTYADDASFTKSKARKLGKLTKTVAMTATDAEIAALRATPGVKSVHPDRQSKVLTDISVPLVGAPKVWEGNGATGQGVTVAVIDSGIDYNHPDLGAGFGEGKKVVGGYDFVNLDSDPMDDHSHGTHVAGIIAGKAAAPGGVTGVAPGAELLAYKVASAEGWGWESDIIAAIEAAADPANPHRAEVINISMGSSGDGTGPVAQAAKAAIAQGVVVVASAGNDGPYYFTLSDLASADEVIAVGASISNLRYPEARIAGTHKEPISAYRGGASAEPPASTKTGQVVDLGPGTPEDFARAGDLTGKVALVEMFVSDNLSWMSQYEYDVYLEAQRRGAIALLGGASGGGPVALNEKQQRHRLAPMNEQPEFRPLEKLVVLGADGNHYEDLRRRAAASRVDVEISGVDLTDDIAWFSSRGPTWGYQLKPDLVAPGWAVRSTVPQGGYSAMSGTSMAAPHVAGAAALMRQVKPGHSPAQVKSALVNASKPLPGTEPFAAGAGRLDVAAAAATSITASPTSLSFGMADLSNKDVVVTKPVTLRNDGTSAQTVRFKASSAVATVSPDQVTVPAGSTVTVTAKVSTPRPDSPQDLFGTITATPQNGPALTIPYWVYLLPLVVQANPDPSDGKSTIYVASYRPLAESMTIQVKPPKGAAFTVPATRNGDYGYTAEVSGADAGSYVITATGRATSGQVLYGAGGFDLLAAEERRNQWSPVGPNTAEGKVALSPSAPKQAVAAQDYKAGPWSTEDGGATWTQHNRLPVTVSGGQGEVIIDSKNPNRWWYRVNDAFVGQDRILRTDDRGKTWTTLTTSGRLANSFVSDSQTRVLVAVSDSELEISTDGGNTWRSIPAGTSGVLEATLKGDNLYLRTARGLFVRSGILSGDPAPIKQIYASERGRFVASVAATDQVIAAVVWGIGVIVSYDGGKTWSTAVALSFGAHAIYESGGDLFFSTLRRYTSVSRDHGRTWTQVSNPNQASVFVDYDKWADGSVTVSAGAAGIYRGVGDANGYKRIGVQGSTVFDLAVAGNQLVAGTFTGTYRTGMPVASPEWGHSGEEGMVGVTISHLAVSPSDPNVVWRVRKSAFGSFTMERSDDAGQTWRATGSGSEVPTSLGVHPADPNRVMVGYSSLAGQGLHITNDGGGFWKRIDHAQPVTAIAGDPRDANRWLLGTPEGLYRTDDGGITMVKSSTNVGWVNTIRVDGSRVVVGGQGMWVSEDGGRKFLAADLGPLRTTVYDVVRVGDKLYAATSRGVLRAGEGGMNWKSASMGLQARDARCLAVSPDGKALYVGVVDGGVHRMSLS